MFHPRGPTFLELMRQGLSSTVRGYDLLAPKFDYTPFRTPEPILDGAAKRIGAPRSVGRALDLCCGTGAAMRMLRPLCRDLVVGIDFSSGMLDVARERNASAPGNARLEFVRGDVLKIPFADDFDLAVCFGALGHIPREHEPLFVDQIARVLRPGGRFVFATTHLPPLASPARWLARGFNAAMLMRNLLIKPPFVMYYLTFLLPGAAQLLEARGFDVEVRDDAWTGRWRGLSLVIARRRPDGRGKLSGNSD